MALTLALFVFMFITCYGIMYMNDSLNNVNKEVMNIKIEILQHLSKGNN